MSTLGKSHLAQTAPLSKSTADQESQFFLPDLCRVQVVFSLIIVTELVALLLTLIHADDSLLDWEYLGLISLFGNWVVLTSAALLCVLRKPLARLPLAVSSTLCFLLIQAITLFYSIGVDHYLPDNILIDREQTLNWQFILRNLTISIIIGGTTLRYFFLQHQWRRQRQAELEARLQALQARIRPHFLFNSMNTIASLIAIDPHAAEEAVLDLSELFRATLGDQRQLIPLREELALCHRYLRIEALRLGDRMKIEWQIETLNLDARLPPLILQPLVENAIYHGIQPRKEGGIIRIQGQSTPKAHQIWIENPLPTTTQGDSSSEHKESQHQGNKIALQNIRDRLEGIFGDLASLKASHDQSHYRVEISIPVYNGR